MNQTNLLSEAHLSWIGHEDAPIEIEVSRRDIIKYSMATEQKLQKYLDGDEAPLMFIFNSVSYTHLTLPTTPYV